MIAKHLLKRPLQIQGAHSFSFSAGTEIETTDQTVHIGDMLCRQIIVGGRKHPAYQPDIDEAVRPRDFTQGKLGIRVLDNDCAIIEKKPGVEGWVEDGHRFPLPVPVGFDSVVTIPASRLALAFKAYEIEHPASGLRELLMKKPARSKAE